MKGCYYDQTHRNFAHEENGNGELERSPLVRWEVIPHRYTDILERISETSEEEEGGEYSDEEKNNPSWRRWYIISVFSLFCLVQGSIFSSWSPIAASTMTAFTDWTDSTISWQSNLSLISSPFFQFPAWCLVARFGVAPIIKWFTVLPLTICSMFRCLPLVTNVSDGTFTTITFITSVCGGWASIIIFTTIGSLVTSWFPQGEQTLATGVAVLAINIGSIVSSLVGPAIVQDPIILFPDINHTSSHTHWLDVSWKLRSQIGHFMLFHFILVLIVLLLVFIYFPSAPNKLLQSRSRADTGEKSSIGIKEALRDENLQLLLFINSSLSLPFMWEMSLLDVTLKPFNVNQKTVGYLTTITIVFSGLFIIITSRLNDKFPSKTKTLLIGLTLLASIFSSLLGLQTLGIITSSRLFLFLCIILSGSLLSCGKPILIQAAVEITPHIQEPVVTALLNQTFCILTSTFLFFYSISPIFASWSSLCLIISPLMALIALSRVSL